MWNHNYVSFWKTEIWILLFLMASCCILYQCSSLNSVDGSMEWAELCLSRKGSELQFLLIHWECPVLYCFILILFSSNAFKISDQFDCVPFRWSDMYCRHPFSHFIWVWGFLEGAFSKCWYDPSYMLGMGIVFMSWQTCILVLKIMA